jgi:phospholipid N-methyltransferase
MASSTAAQRGLLFFRSFLGSPRHVGALLPSTRWLGEEMIRGLQLAPGDLLVEYGAGTGSLTASIARQVALTPGVKYLGIERDAGFCDVLRQRFPELEFANGAVEDVTRLLADRGLPAPRVILSGLPLILLPTMESIVATAATLLRPGGEFRTFSYLQSWPLPATARLRLLMRRHFASFRQSPLVLRNFPPAFVLSARRAS